MRGACRISGNFAIFCKIFAQNLRDLDAGLARYLALERTSTRKRAATKVCGSCNHAGRIYATFLRAACRKFSETLQFFRASWAQKLCDPDAGRLFFSDVNAKVTWSPLSDVVRYSQVTIDECTQFFARGACRISGNFAIFCKIFAQNLRAPADRELCIPHNVAER